MKSIRSTLVLLVFAAACAKSSPSERTIVASNSPHSTENNSELHNESSIPASRTPDAVQETSTIGMPPSNADTRLDTSLSHTEAPAERSATAPRTPDVIYVPTPQVIVDKMLALAKLKKGDVLYDLGCGDGRIVVSAAKKYRVKAVGFDIDPKRVEEARANVQDNKVEDLVSIEQKDIFTIDLSPASVVTLYLLPSLNDRLLPQLEKLAPGSRVVSHDYGITDIVPVRHLTLKPTSDAQDHEIYFWTTPFQRKTALSQLGKAEPRALD